MSNWFSRALFLRWEWGRKSAKIRFWGRKEDNGKEKRRGGGGLWWKRAFFWNVLGIVTFFRPSLLPKIGWRSESGGKIAKRRWCKNEPNTTFSKFTPIKTFYEHLSRNMVGGEWWTHHIFLFFVGGRWQPIPTLFFPIIRYLFGKKSFLVQKSPLYPIQQHLFARHPFEPFVTCLSVCPGHLYFQTHYFLLFSCVGRIPPIFFATWKHYTA